MIRGVLHRFSCCGVYLLRRSWIRRIDPRLHRRIDLGFGDHDLILPRPRAIIWAMGVEMKRSPIVGHAVGGLTVPADGQELHHGGGNRFAIEIHGSLDSGQLVATAARYDQDSSRHNPPQTSICHNSIHLNNPQTLARRCGNPNTGRSDG